MTLTSTSFHQQSKSLQEAHNIKVDVSNVDTFLELWNSCLPHKDFTSYCQSWKKPLEKLAKKQSIPTSQLNTKIKLFPFGFLELRVITSISATDNINPKKRLFFVHSLSKHNKKLTLNEAYIFDKSLRRKGFLQDYLKTMVTQHYPAGIDRIKIEATDESAPIVWPRYGWIPNERSTADIEKKIKKALGTPLLEDTRNALKDVIKNGFKAEDILTLSLLQDSVINEKILIDNLEGYIDMRPGTLSRQRLEKRLGMTIDEIINESKKAYIDSLPTSPNTDILNETKIPDQETRGKKSPPKEKGGR